MKGEIKSAVIPFGVDYIIAFRSSVVSGLLLRTEGSPANRDSVRSYCRCTTHQDHGVCGLGNDDPIDSLLKGMGRRRPTGFEKEDRQE
jgi:hypothetical protein